MATRFSILAWKIPLTEELVGYSPWDCKESDMTERLHFTIAKTRKQSKYSLIDKWIKEMWYMYTTEYYSATKE